MLGALSFSAGLQEPIVLSNRKLMLGVSLVLAGLLYHAGLNWRFRSRIRSIESLAVVFWAVLLAIVVWLEWTYR